MQVHIDLFDRVRVYLGKTATTALPEDVYTALCKAFTHSNPDHRRNERVPPFLPTWRLDHFDNGRWLALPRGGLARVRQVLRDHGLEWKVADRRSDGDAALAGAIPALQFPLWDYQREAIKAGVTRQNCLWRAPTGCGKTTGAFGLIAEVNLPAIVIVYDGGLFRQWVTRCTSELGLKPSRVGQVKGGPKTWRFGPVTVASAKTLAQHPEFWDEHGWRFGIALADEVQGFAAQTMFKAIDPAPARYRVGVSADETRKDQKEFLVYDLFGAVGCEIDQARVIAGGHVLDVRVRVVPTDFRADWYRQQYTLSDNAKKRAWTRLLEEIAKDDDRNTLAIDIVRAEAAKRLQVIVWSERVEHCRHLDNQLAHHGVLSGLMLGGKPQEKVYEQTRLGLIAGKLNAGVGTRQAIGEGVDIPIASRGVLTTPLAGNRQRFGQVRGRLCRAPKNVGKVDAELYYLWDQHVYGARHLENLVKWYGRMTVVWDDGAWVDGATYLKRFKGQRNVAAGDLDGLFA